MACGRMNLEISRLLNFFYLMTTKSSAALGGSPNESLYDDRVVFLLKISLAWFISLGMSATDRLYFDL